MNDQRKKGEGIHREVKFIYSVYGEDEGYGGNATITVHYGAYTKEHLITLVVASKTMDEAEEAIIRDAKSIIDNILGL